MRSQHEKSHIHTVPLSGILIITSASTWIWACSLLDAASIRARFVALPTSSGLPSMPAA